MIEMNEHEDDLYREPDPEDMFRIMEQRYGPEFVAIARRVRKELIEDGRPHGVFAVLVTTKQRMCTSLPGCSEPLGLNCEGFSVDPDRC